MQRLPHSGSSVRTVAVFTNSGEHRYLVPTATSYGTALGVHATHAQPDAYLFIWLNGT